ncbi:MAG: hypothetical protein PHV37_08155 [Candidatus Gastranaerophilales bacterium]|nr:hypothetical protein [Candidatus Gastranaerophilales bacterium]
MLLVDDQRQLIEKIVKANPKFNGNEDLLEDFCNEAFQKTYIVFNSGSNIQKIESYVSKVVNTSILSVLKNMGRVRRSTKKYVSTGEIPLSQLKHKPDFSTASSSSNQGIVSFDFADPKESVEEIVVKKDLLQRIADVVCTLHKENPQKCFLDIFYLRYMKNFKQNQISTELNLSQSEVSKRLLELSKLIKTHIK